ncbi:hypothetical protein ACFOSS_11420 [Pseudaeromonas sharmana]|uniref:DUF2306 domain-containing protein n=1 Tax=Pseudaeromonas sharmana TaxID=328412 RepID=A0ABV8CQ89_9GAMM
MVWYTLAALHCFLLAMLAQQWRQPESQNRQPALGTGMMISLLLMNVAGFYPLLMAYFHLYPISTPNHFAIVLLLWQLTLSGLLVTFAGPRSLRVTRLAKWTGLPLQVALGLISALVATVVLRMDMASGSLLSAWTPLFVLASTLLSIAYWNLLLRAAHRLAQPSSPQDAD